MKTSKNAIKKCRACYSKKILNVISFGNLYLSDFVKTNKTAIEQILINLVANAIKYNDKENAAIEIEVLEEDDFYKISVDDNGPGILKDYHEIIFQIFEVVSNQDRFGKKGNGIGLATVKKIVEDLGGTIRVESEMGKGSKFIFTIARL